MPIIPFAAAVGAALGTSAAVGGTIVAGTALAGGLAVSQAMAQKKAASQAKNDSQAAQQQNTAANVPGTTVGGSANTTANAQNNGRAALISTSPTGVQGLDPTQRRSLLGN